MADESPPSIGSFLVRMHAITRDELLQGLQVVAAAPTGSARPSLGETLIQLGHISPDDLREAHRRFAAAREEDADLDLAKRRAAEHTVELAREALRAHARDQHVEKTAGNHILSLFREDPAARGWKAARTAKPVDDGRAKRATRR